MLRKGHRLWKRVRHTGSAHHYQIYKKVRNAIVTLNRKNITAYASNIDLHLGECVDSKGWWRNIKTLLSSKGHQSIPPLLHEGYVEIFNHYFSEQCHLPIIANTTLLPTFTHKTTSRLTSLSFTCEEVKIVSNCLSYNKATGPDGIGYLILKSVSKSISQPLCKLFNYSLQKGQFPTSWKVANVSPVFKNK